MTYIITEPCVDVKDGACVDVCPVDCIYGLDNENDRLLYIEPDECIDCAACEPVCPVAAIFPEEDVPEKWKSWIPVNYEYFKDEAGTREKVNQIIPKE
jgi:NAD-dependent dihydropyrimidine dehydrogenase PreA subunit